MHQPGLWQKNNLTFAMDLFILFEILNMNHGIQRYPAPSHRILRRSKRDPLVQSEVGSVPDASGFAAVSALVDLHERNGNLQVNLNVCFLIFFCHA